MRLLVAGIIGVFVGQQVVMTCLLCLVMAPASAAAQPLSIERLLSAGPDGVDGILESARPVAVSPEVKSRVLASLPDHGEVTHLSAASRRKLGALAPVLRAARREASYETKVIDVPQAAIGLYAATVLLVSHPALTLLSASELQAVVGHEIGHEYMAADYDRAAAVGDFGRLQELELVCDAVAVVTLRAVGQDATPLLTGLEKLMRFNRDRFDGVLDVRRHPSFEWRRAVIRAFEARLGPRPVLGPGRPE